MLTTPWLINARSCGSGRYLVSGTCKLCNGEVRRRRRWSHKEECTSCPIGKVTATFQDDCRSCSTGHYVVAGSCRACRSSSADDCISCRPGYHAVSGRCKPCYGELRMNSTGAQCISCPPGKVNAHGQDQCKPCEGQVRRSSQYSYCIPCLRGKGPVAGQDNCESCPSGKYADGYSVKICTACPAGKTSDHRGASCRSTTSASSSCSADTITSCKWWKWLCTRSSWVRNRCQTSCGCPGSRRLHAVNDTVQEISMGEALGDISFPGGVALI